MTSYFFKSEYKQMRVNHQVMIWIVLCGFLCFATGCEAKEDTTPIVDKTKQVTVVTIEEASYKETLNYIGFVTAEVMVPLKFQTSGEIKQVNFEEGDVIKKGDVIAELVNYGQITDLNNKLYAPISGIVSELYMKQGSLISSEYPSVLVVSNDRVVNVGVTAEDYGRLKGYTNPIAYFMINQVKYTAKITNFDHVPDAKTRTYQVTLTLDPDQKAEKLIIGEIGTAFIELSRVNGYWIPISWIQNDGSDYVYIVNSENRVERRNLTLSELNGDKVRVEGINGATRVITVGNSFVKEGQLVTVREGSDE